MTSAAVLESRPQESADPVYPNKYPYPEFAGLNGERRMRKIVRYILPLSAFRTWEVYVDEQVAGNDCFLGVPKTMEEARRCERTVQRNLSWLTARELLDLRVEQKIFVDPDGSVRKKPVVIKDFSGLYALAHEYYEWYQSEDFVQPERAFVELIRLDPQLEAKLRRFEDYRRVLYQHPRREAEVREEVRWFTEYSPEKRVEDAEEQKSGQNPTFLSSEMSSKMSQERINEKDYSESLKRDSSDSGASLEKGGEASASEYASGQQEKSPAPDYTKNEKTGKTTQNGDKTNTTNPSSSPQEKGPARPASKRRESEEQRQDVRMARQAMAAAGLEARPPKHALARSFVHEVAGAFGDLNVKGSVTRVERRISASGLEDPAEVLLCLVRAYVVARDTKDEKVRHRHPQTKHANRMPLFCTMVERFLQARASGGKWEYSWQELKEDIGADDRLGLWLSEHEELLRKPAEETNEQPKVTIPESFGHRESGDQVEEQAAVAPSTTLVEARRLHAEADQAEERELPNGETQVADVEERELPNGETLVEPTSQQPRRSKRSQTPEEREARAERAYKVMRRLMNQGVPMEAPTVDGEHYACGCPLSYSVRNTLFGTTRRCCALCEPYPLWSEETMALIRSIMEPAQATADVSTNQPLPMARGWSDYEQAYEWMAYLAEQLAENGYGDLTFKLQEEKESGRYRIIVQDATTGGGYRLSSPEGVQSMVDAACERRLSFDPVSD